VYHRGTGKLLERLSGHEGPINSVAWHPTHHALFASASDDSTVRIWTPSDIGRFRALNVSEREAGDALASGRRGAVGAISGVSSRAYGHAASASTSSGPTPFPWERSPHAAASDDDAELSLPAEPSDMFMSS
jgi:WD40 repeat protein